jgi:ribosome-associated heat shock protein Hsp15
LVYGAALRLDKWLWFSRLAKTRSDARALCESRRLRIDGRVVERASALVRAGQVLSFPLHEKVMVVRVEGLADRRGPYVEAQHMYTDLAADGAGMSQAGMFTPALCQEALTQGAASF